MIRWTGLAPWEFEKAYIYLPLQYEELLVGAAHAKARLTLQRSRLAEAELKEHQQRAAALLAQAKVNPKACKLNPQP